MEPLFRFHSWVLAAAAVGTSMLKYPGAAKVLGAVALADVAGRQLSPRWAALVAGWYPTGSAGTASVVAPLRTVEEVRAKGVHEVAARSGGAISTQCECPPGQVNSCIGACCCVPKPVQLARTRTIHTLAGLLSL